MISKRRGALVLAGGRQPRLLVAPMSTREVVAFLSAGPHTVNVGFIAADGRPLVDLDGSRARSRR